MAAQGAIAGSTEVGEWCMIGGQAAFQDILKLETCKYWSTIRNTRQCERGENINRIPRR